MAKLTYTLPDLSYAYDALEPVISKEIMTLHHDKHHAGYVNGANSALETLEQIRNGGSDASVKHTMKDLSFNLNGHILHSIFWENMRSPMEDNRPSEEFQKKLAENFGSYEMFIKEYSAAAKSVEGSGWAVLATDESGNLFIFQVEKHNQLHLSSFKPLLVIDVWEHAYYIDYKNDRGAYVDGFWSIVNWEYVESEYSKSLAA